MSDGYALEAGVLADAAETLSAVSGELEAQAGDLAVAPDAGSSSGEVSSAFGDLSAGLRALSEVVSGAAEQLRLSESAYQRSDDSAARTYGSTPGP